MLEVPSNFNLLAQLRDQAIRVAWLPPMLHLPKLNIWGPQRMPLSRPNLMPAAGTADFSWRLTSDAMRVHAIHSAVLARTPAGMVRPDPITHFENHIARHGVTLGCFLDDGQMVGYGVLGFDSLVVDHLSGLLKADTRRFAVLDGAAALPEWRGCGLHQAGIEQRIAHAAASGRTLIGATVAPHNLRALRSMFRAGLQIHAFALMYGGLVRLIVQRDMLLPLQQFDRACSVPVADHAGHQAALADGLVGFGCSQDQAGNWRIDYGRAS
jgi:hypothetical protein